jgi:hypothetical protein
MIVVRIMAPYGIGDVRPLDPKLQSRRVTDRPTATPAPLIAPTASRMIENVRAMLQSESP